MRTVLSATWLGMAIAAFAADSALAQMTPPSTAGTRPKPVVTTPVRPAQAQTPADTANAMAQAERLALQSDLAWVGEYNGAITGEVSERMVAAIKDYQKGRGAQGNRRAQSAGTRCPRRHRKAAAGECRLEDHHRHRHRRPPRHSRKAGAAAVE